MANKIYYRDKEYTGSGGFDPSSSNLLTAEADRHIVVDPATGYMTISDNFEAGGDIKAGGDIDMDGDINQYGSGYWLKDSQDAPLSGLKDALNYVKQGSDKALNSSLLAAEGYGYINYDDEDGLQVQSSVQAVDVVNSTGSWLQDASTDSLQETLEYLSSHSSSDDVSQTLSSSDSDYRILLSHSTNDDYESAGTYKSGYLTYNPSQKTLSTHAVVADSFTTPNGYFTATGVGEITCDSISVGINANGYFDGKDFVLSGYDNTWDGTNTSLKSAIAAASGGGGTAVIANPSGTATDSLNKLEVGNIIYSVDGGTDVNVLQTETNSTNADYEVILGYTATNSQNKTEGVRKSENFTFHTRKNELSISTPPNSETYNGSYNVAYSSADSNSNYYSSSQKANQIYIDKQDDQHMVLKSITVEVDDITLGGTSNTWDGTNTSLKTAIASAGGNNDAVSQTNSTSNINYRVLLSNSATDATETTGVHKSADLLYNPHDQKLTVPKAAVSTLEVHDIDAGYFVYDSETYQLSVPVAIVTDVQLKEGYWGSGYQSNSLYESMEYIENIIGTRSAYYPDGSFSVWEKLSELEQRIEALEQA